MVQDKKSELKYYDGEDISFEEAEERIDRIVKQTEKQMEDFNFEVFSYYLSKFVDLKAVYQGLDLGCGSGYVSYNLENNSSITMVGMDLSRLALIGAYRFKKKKGFKTELLLGDIENSCFKKDSFDLVLIENTLHHFPDFDTPLKSVNRILKKDGYLIIEDSNLLFPTRLWKAFRLKLKRRPWGTANEWPYHRFRLSKSLKRTGFKVISLRNIRYLPISLMHDRLDIDDFISKIPLVNLFGSRIFCIAQK